MQNPFPAPLDGDSAELATVLHTVSTQWERGDHTAAVASLADAVLIAESDGKVERATTLARALAGLALASRRAPDSPTNVTAWKPEPPTADLIPIHASGFSENEAPTDKIDLAITAKLGEEALAEARARMKIRTADAFKPIGLPQDVRPNVATVPPPMLDLGAVPPFSELPDALRQMLTDAAEMQVIADGQELGAFALALVIDGVVDALLEGEQPKRVRLGAVVSGRPSASTALRLRSSSGAASVAIWRANALDPLLAAFPSMRDKLGAYVGGA